MNKSSPGFSIISRVYEKSCPCHMLLHRHWQHPICTHADSYIGYKTMVLDITPRQQSRAGRSRVPGEWESLQTNSQPCRSHDKWALLFWVSAGHSLCMEGLWSLHGESDGLCENERSQEQPSWTAVLKGQWMEDLLTRGCLCYVPTLSNLINSRTSNYHLHPHFSTCPWEAVKSPPASPVKMQ